MSTTPTAAAPPRAFSDVVSEEVRVLLARRGLRSGALAPVLGVSQQAVSAKMRGIRSWSLEDLDALARYFGVDANALLPGLGKQGAEVKTQSQMLPHLDSNQEPAGYLQQPPLRAIPDTPWRWPLAQRARTDRAA
jgi:transcriptional regulator with XRE-family HTH domain